MTTTAASSLFSRGRHPSASCPLPPPQLVRWVVAYRGVRVGEADHPGPPPGPPATPPKVEPVCAPESEVPAAQPAPGQGEAARPTAPISLSGAAGDISTSPRSRPTLEPPPASPSRGEEETRAREGEEAETSDDEDAVTQHHRRAAASVLLRAPHIRRTQCVALLRAAIQRYQNAVHETHHLPGSPARPPLQAATSFGQPGLDSQAMLSQHECCDVGDVRAVPVLITARSPVPPPSPLVGTRSNSDSAPPACTHPHREANDLLPPFPPCQGGLGRRAPVGAAHA